MAPKMGYCLLALLCLVFVSSASVVRNKRDSEMDLVPELTRPTVEPRFTTTLEDKFCQPDTPCGWVVYTPFTRNQEYFMRNTYCRCAAPQECVNTGDDISISAFIFRCRVPKATTVTPSTTTTTTES